MESDKEIIRSILSERDNTALIKEKMYRILYEASSVDDVNMDTDLIDECVKIIDLLEGREEHLSADKIKASQELIEQKYQKWLKSQRKSSMQKRIPQIAAAVLLIFLASSAVANALGYNLIQSIVSWGQDTFHLSTSNQPDGQNLLENKTYDSVEQALKDIPAGIYLPTWFPEGFEFKYAEKFAGPKSTDISLYYQDSAGQHLIINIKIYSDVDDKGTAENVNFEKDENLVEVYTKDNIGHYIFSNLDQIQAVWLEANTAYNIMGDITPDEIKKIIESM